MAVIDSLLHQSSFHESSPGVPRDVWWQCITIEQARWQNFLNRFIFILHKNKQKP